MFFQLAINEHYLRCHQIKFLIGMLRKIATAKKVLSSIFIFVYISYIDVYMYITTQTKKLDCKHK